MKQLSIIIVNYNSKKYLERCLLSVNNAIINIDHEIIIIDNNSTDGSRDYLAPEFPGVKFIFNKENVGFAKACNQGFKISSGNYVLFLNPDTVIAENSVTECISFLNSHQDAGAVGVRMLNEEGAFLKESKRGFPSPAASFYKLFGLTELFPHSKIFAKYYLGHLPENKINPVDVLSGAFMIVRKEVFEITGGFDETFFMYGEDIDLSYRIQQAGYKNYYLGTISITHAKGGSTIYDIHYIKNFYGAMRFFVKKHFAGKKSLLAVSFMYAGIEVRKWLAILTIPFR
jgi:GT2 family glycosyltransferase